MTFLVERLAKRRRYVEHAERLRARGVDRRNLAENLTLRNDVLFTLLTMAQLVIDIAGELCARRGVRFDTYREAIRHLSDDPRFPGDLAATLERLAGFRNIVVHEYIGIDDAKVVEALNELEPVRRLLELVERSEAGGSPASS